MHVVHFKMVKSKVCKLHLNQSFFLKPQAQPQGQHRPHSRPEPATAGQLIPHPSTRVMNDRPSLLGVSTGFTKMAEETHVLTPSHDHIQTSTPESPGDQLHGSPGGT